MAADVTDPIPAGTACESTMRPSALSIVHVQRWTPLEVGSWLQAVGLGHFAERFVSQNIAGDVLFDITQKDLTEMGVVLIGDKKRLLKALKALREEAKTGPRPHLDVAVLGASPLVHVMGSGDSLEVVPLDMIDLAREQDLLRRAVRESKNFVPGGLQPTFAIGTFQQLSKVLQLGAKVLALTGHTTPAGKILLETETETGQAVEFDPSVDLPSLVHAQGADATMPVCIVLTSCYSREAGRAFLDFGARHVVAVERTATVLDSAARVFNATFHHALLVGRTVADAFRFAVSHVRHSSHIGGDEAGKFVLLPDDVPGRHDVALFGSSPWRSVSGPPDLDQVPPSERREINVVGRQRDMWQVILALEKSRCVVICGVGGVGKAALCRGVAEYLQDRGSRFCADGLHIVCLRGIRTVHAAQAQLRDVLDEAVSVATRSAPEAAVSLHSAQLPKSAAFGPSVSAAGAILSDAVEVDSAMIGCPASETLEQTLGRLGERLLVLTNAEEVLHAEPQDMSRFLDGLLRAGPRLRVLLTSRRAVPTQAWLSQSPAPHHIYLRQLEPNASARLLLHMAPTLGKERVQQIATLCGHLPLALKVVGQRLAVASDPLAEANDFVTETENSPEKRAALLFSQCVAPYGPYVWRTLDAARRAALAALSLLRGTFDLSAAAAVLGVSLHHAEALLDEFRDQCLIEQPEWKLYFMPTSVHLVVQQQFVDNIPAGEAAVKPSTNSTAPGIHLAGASVRLALHFVALLRDVARGVASDRGKSGAGLEALRAFDRHRADIDVALALAGNSDLFIAMVQLGRDVFDTRLSAQRRVEIYERLLGILLARRTAKSGSTSKGPRAENNIRQLLRRFGEARGPDRDLPATPICGKSSVGLARTVSTPVPPSYYGGRPIAKTVPCTPVNPRTPISRRTTSSDIEDDDSGLLSRRASPGLLKQAAIIMDGRHDAGRCSAPPGKQAVPGGLLREHAAAENTNDTPAAAPAAKAPLLVRRHSFHGSLSEGMLAPPATPKHKATSSTATPKHKTASSAATAAGPVSSPQPAARPAALPSPPLSPKVAAVSPDAGSGPPQASRPGMRPAYRRPPSYVFASSDGAGSDGAGESASRQAPGAEHSEASEFDAAAAADGTVAFRPAWCQVLTAEQNPSLRRELEAVLHFTGPGLGALETARLPGKQPPVGLASAEMPKTGAEWGDPRVLWHEEEAHDSVLVEVLLRLGLAYSSLGRFAHAAQLLRKALLRVEEMTQRGSTIGVSAEGMRAELLGALSGVLCQQSLWQDAEAMLWQARQLAKHAGYTELYVRLTCDLAEFNHKFKGNMKAADRLFKTGLEMRRKNLGVDHLDTATTFNAVGVFSAQRGNFEEAGEYVTQAIKVRCKILGSQHISVAEALHNLANIKESLQNNSEAAKLYEHALQIKTQVLPSGHVSIADTQNNLSILYSKMKRHEECVGLLRRTLDQCLRTVGEVNASTASVLMNLGHALHSLASAHRAESSISAYAAQLDEAQGMLERALTVKKALFHKQHPSIAQCRANLGYVHFKKNEFAEAKRHFTASLRICRRHYGGAHPDVAKWLYWVGKTQMAMHQESEARESLRAALQISELQRVPGGPSSLSLDAGHRSARRSSIFTQEQLEDIFRLVHGPYSQGEASSPVDEDAVSEPAGEPAAEPPSEEPADRSEPSSAEVPSVEAIASAPAKRLHRLRPQIMLSLEPEEATSTSQAPTDGLPRTNCSSPSATSTSGSESLYDTRIPSIAGAAGESMSVQTSSSPRSEAELSCIMRTVRRSAEEYQPASWEDA